MRFRGLNYVLSILKFLTVQRYNIFFAICKFFNKKIKNVHFFCFSFV